MTMCTFPSCTFYKAVATEEKVEFCRYGKSAIICSAGIPNKEATLPVRSKTQALAFCIVKKKIYTGLFITGFTTKYMAIP